MIYNRLLMSVVSAMFVGKKMISMMRRKSIRHDNDMTMTSTMTGTGHRLGVQLKMIVAYSDEIASFPWLQPWHYKILLALSITSFLD